MDKLYGLSCYACFARQGPEIFRLSELIWILTFLAFCKLGEIGIAVWRRDVLPTDIWNMQG